MENTEIWDFADGKDWMLGVAKKEGDKIIIQVHIAGDQRTLGFNADNLQTIIDTLTDEKDISEGTFFFGEEEVIVRTTRKQREEILAKLSSF